jgi:hypothetical protein
VEGFVSKRKSRPQLRVIAGGGGKSGAASPREKISDLPRPAAEGATSSLARQAAEFAQKVLPDSPDEELFDPRYYEDQHARRHVAADVDRLRYAIVDLATIELAPAQLLKEIDPTFDKPVIRDRLIRAIDCLTQFAEEWRMEELSEAARKNREGGEG